MSGVSALGAAFAPANPTGIAFFDVAERAAIGGVVPLVAARSRHWSWVVLFGAAVVVSGSVWGLALGVLALGAAAYHVVRASRPGPLTGAAAGALGIQVLLRGAPIGPFGSTALLGTVAVGILGASAYAQSDRATRQRVRLVLGGVVGFVVVATVGFAISLAQAAPKMENGLRLARAGLAEASDGKPDLATLGFFVANRDLADAHLALDSPIAKLAYAVPVLSQQARMLVTASGAATDVTAAARRAASAAPYQSLRTSEGSFDLARIDSMRAPIRATLATSERTIAQMRSVSSPWLVGNLAERASEYQGELADAVPKARQALRALQVAPVILGADRPRHYLVLFANPAESRGMGGFVGAWAQLDVADGHIELARHGHIDDLIGATDWHTRHISGEKEYLSRYARLQPARYLQNITASPDFPTVARVAEQLYPQAGGTHLDGVIYVDPIALAALLKITGPVHAKGIPMPLDAANAADYLMHDQYLGFRGRNPERYDLLSNAAEATFEALTHGALPAVSTITDTLAPMVHQRRLLFWVNDPTARRYLSSVGLTGAFPAPNGGDVFSVRVANASANKADYYLDQLATYTVHYDPSSGNAQADARIFFANGAPSRGEPGYVLGNQDTRAKRRGGRPYGSETVTFSVYSALRPNTMTIDGATTGIQVQRELGCWVASQTVTIPAGGRVAVDVRFAGRLDAEPTYRLSVVPQAGARRHVTAAIVEPTNGAGKVVPGLTVRKTFDGNGSDHLVVPATRAAARGRPDGG